MKVKGVRLHGAHDIRLEEFELPEIQNDEILVKVVSDSICMSTWKMVQAIIFQHLLDHAAQLSFVVDCF